MKLKIIGIVLFLLSLISCTKEEFVPLYGNINETYIEKPLKGNNTEFKTFSEIKTKATLTPIWVNGDLITVYSVDENNDVLFIDTCAVYNINSKHQNLASIKAEVAKECEGYFAAYPYDLFNYKIGDHITINYEDPDFHGNVDIDRIKPGTLGVADAMTSWCYWCESSGYFKFESRISLFRIKKVKTSDYPITTTFYMNGKSRTVKIYGTDTEIYVPIATTNTSISKIDINYHSNNRHKIIYPTIIIRVGTIYDYNLN